MPAAHDVVIIGAGLAGLTAARHLHDHGVDALLLDAADDVGGRVRTDAVDGLLLDRGFQLVNPSYPEARRFLDLDALDLRGFTAGVIAMTPSGPARLADPRSKPLWSLHALSQRSGSVLSKARFAMYAVQAARTPIAHLQQRPDVSAYEALRAAHIDEQLIDTVLRPFLAGVFLEGDLSTSRRMMDLILRSFVLGTPSVPAAGMQAIPRQLRAGLAPDAVRLNTEVRAVARGQVVTGDATITAKAVVVATSAPAAAALLPALAVPEGRSVTTWYFVADQPGTSLAGGDPVLTVDAYGAVLNTVVMTNAAPTYASGGRTLVAASALGLQTDDDARRRVLAHLARIYRVDTGRWQHVATYPIAFALPAMTPPLQIRQPVDLGGGVFVAGDHRDTASIQGAMVSGRRTADAVLSHLGVMTS